MSISIRDFEEQIERVIKEKLKIRLSSFCEDGDTKVRAEVLWKDGYEWGQDGDIVTCDEVTL